jgi:hypothetical protein
MFMQFFISYLVSLWQCVSDILHNLVNICHKKVKEKVHGCKCTPRKIYILAISIFVIGRSMQILTSTLYSVHS